jgi:hypothetical protein
MTTIFDAPASRAPLTALSPTPPAPKITTLSPTLTLAVFKTEPAPVTTPHPSSAAWANGSSLGTTASWFSWITGPTAEKQQKKKDLKVVSLDFFAPNDLTEGDFQELAESGTIDPQRIYFSQLRCSPAFRAAIVLGDGTVCPGIWELSAALKRKDKLADDVQPIKIIWFSDKVTSVDNRRLKAHREAGVKIRYVKWKWSDLTSGEKSHFDPQAPASNINVT